NRLVVRQLRCGEPRWCTDPPGQLFQATVQLRAHATPLRAHVDPNGDELTINLLEPTFGIAPGQMAAIYRGAQVLGSAIINTAS
ncbi:MAG: tRNA 2-thiouridine(34) synthase MnmA, partial [Propionibacteriaceae bacterium]|nr:tRNA 2-thiouridine(34) synthase MnmA [Propionibacteriaceae bacterium]